MPIPPFTNVNGVQIQSNAIYMERPVYDVETKSFSTKTEVLLKNGTAIVIPTDEKSSGTIMTKKIRGNVENKEELNEKFKQAKKAGKYTSKTKKTTMIYDAKGPMTVEFGADSKQ